MRTNLIAAAPELLESLQAITDHYERINGDYHTYDEPVVIRARRVLAAAKGERFECACRGCSEGVSCCDDQAVVV